jgi:hypothetical protein
MRKYFGRKPVIGRVALERVFYEFCCGAAPSVNGDDCMSASRSRKGDVTSFWSLFVYGCQLRSKKRKSSVDVLE